MSNNNFISSSGWFSFTLTDGWVEYDDGDDSTYAFWNGSETSWTGNFRITPFRWLDITDPNEDKAGEYIDSEIAENAGAQRIRLGEWDCVHYKKESQQDGAEQVVYYWATGACNDLFLCSFTIDKEQEIAPVNVRELTSIQNMISSIKIL